MDNYPLVSVILPTYNRCSLAIGAIDNVTEQDYPNIEIIVVDDGSFSNIDEYVNKISNNNLIYIKHSYNKGLSASRNTGIEASSGEYIAFIDDDDRWFNNKISLQMEKFKIYKNKYKLIYCLNSHQNHLSDKTSSKLYYKGKMSKYIFDGCLLPSSSMIMHRKVINLVGGFSEELHSCIDHDMWMNLAKNNIFMDYIDKPLVYSIESEGKRMINDYSNRLLGIDQFFMKWKKVVIYYYGIDSWLNIESKYNIQTSYSIVKSYRNGKLSITEALLYIQKLFSLLHFRYYQIDTFLAKFALSYSTFIFNYIPLNRIFSTLFKQNNLR